MTTIAYKDGVIAYDSRMTAYDIVVDDNCDKLFIKDDIAIFYCGAFGDVEEFVDCVLNDVAPGRELNCEALVLFGNTLYCVDIFETRIRKIPLNLDNIWAIGSGFRLALAFMDTGMSAEEAVRATCKRDIYTGGTIRTFKIDR